MTQLIWILLIVFSCVHLVYCAGQEELVLKEGAKSNVVGVGWDDIRKSELPNCESDPPSDQSLQCPWAAACINSDSHIPYEYIYYCHVRDPKTALPLLFLWSFYVCYLAGTVVDTYLSSVVLQIVEILQISEVLAGCTLLAFTNAAGDVIMGIWTAVSEEQQINIYVGDVLGSALFLTNAVFGSVLLFSRKKSGIKLYPINLIRDICFLFIGLLLMMIAMVGLPWRNPHAWIKLSPKLIPQHVSIWLFFLPLIAYALYVLCVVFFSSSDDGAQTVENISLVHKNSVETGSQNVDERAGQEVEEYGTFTLNASFLEPYSGKGSFLSSLSNNSDARPHSDSGMKGGASKQRQFGSLLDVPVSHRANSVQLAMMTRSGRKIVSKVMSQTSLLTRKSVMEDLCSSPGKTIFRESFQGSLMSSAASKENIQTDFGCKSSDAPFTRILSFLSNGLFYVLVYPWIVLWNFTTPAVDFSPGLTTIQPFCIGIFVLANQWREITWIWVVVCVGLGGGISTLMFAWPQYFRDPLSRSPLSYVRLFVGVVMSLQWNVLLIAELVKAVKTIGLICNISAEILGLTIVAWGNSVADLLANVSVARSGYPEMGLTSCFGAAIFCSLVGTSLVGFLSALVGRSGPTSSIILTLTPGTLFVLRAQLIFLPVMAIIGILVNFKFRPVHGLLFIVSFGLVACGMCFTTVFAE